MRMKEDAMKNGQLKPGYNIQHGVDSEYIVWLTVGDQFADTTILIPFIKSMEDFLYFKIVADAGYESEKTIYTSDDCSNCVHKSKCIKGHNCKTPLEERVKNLETSKLFNMLRKENLERIVNEEGYELRMNRIIQAESSFAEIKQEHIFSHLKRALNFKILKICKFKKINI
ncbi:transposase [Clostridium carboxidivorans P7]|uniref:ISCpe5, transposase n=2 Tax=Clostridium TaxID=1485 RepID=C6PYY6_9CLOT|nr:transposase [Clostridium carboxidivorans]AKN31343.1 transposase [Clostridium carboxidivorans P7]EET85520.1 ISCpe5, transposase [Clostridium carboxidivorans P7]EFG88473.1 hypothetical protein CLCAR_2052 [Clostridium carboxidivorans P7]